MSLVKLLERSSPGVTEHTGDVRFLIVWEDSQGINYQVLIFLKCHCHLATSLARDDWQVSKCLQPCFRTLQSPQGKAFHLKGHL